MAHHYRYIIVGGGVAGASAVEGIRVQDPSGSIALFGKEPHLPYDRPPLSKGLWLGKSTIDQLPVYPRSFYDAHHVHLFLGTEIVEIDREHRRVADREGQSFVYEKLLLATGGTPRTLSFGGDTVRYFRTVDDYRIVREAAETAREFVMIGGGFIGAELAAVLTLQGKQVTMVFPETCILQRIFPEDLAAFVTDYYRDKNVNVMKGEVPTRVARANGRVRMELRSGVLVEADCVVAAIGLNLQTQMASQAGLKVEEGIVVNGFLQTSDPNIYAAGDVARFPVEALGKRMRIEHWNNAQMQGRYAGENMAGAQKKYDYLPYFYSDLFDLGFEAVGDLDGRYQTFADWKEEYREGVVYYLDQARVVGVLLWNVWEKLDAARTLLNEGKRYSQPEQLRERI